MNKKVKMVCSNCRSENVSRDGPHKWDVEKQEWVSEGYVFDGNYCDDCGEEDCVNEVDIEDPVLDSHLALKGRGA